MLYTWMALVWHTMVCAEEIVNGTIKTLVCAVKFSHTHLGMNQNLLIMHYISHVALANVFSYVLAILALKAS